VVRRDPAWLSRAAIRPPSPKRRRYDEDSAAILANRLKISRPLACWDPQLTSLVYSAFFAGDGGTIWKRQDAGAP
jgi:hypothetical protein